MVNKKRADMILALLLVTFIVIILIRKFVIDNFLIDLLGFTVEAALVGGIADWFAVTALFREPFGFSWHTAIIPRNREKVIDAVVKVVKDELLSPEVIKNKVAKLDLMDKAIVYIEKKNIQVASVNLVKKHAHTILDRIRAKKLASYIEDLIKDRAVNIELSGEIRKFLNWFTQSEDYKHALEALQEKLLEVVKKDSTRDEICSIINDEVKRNIEAATGIKRMLLEMALSFAEGTNSLNIPDAAAALQNELVEIVTGLKDENNPLRVRLGEMSAEFMERISSDPNLINSIEEWKQVIVNKLDLSTELEKHLDNLIGESKRVACQIDYDNGEVIICGDDSATAAVRWVIEQINKYWDSFKKNDYIKKTIEDYIKEKLCMVINSEHHLLGVMVKEVLNSFTDEALNEFIERKAGNDLHWIRINGCIVGAVFGFLLYLFTNVFYGPLVVPMIQRMFI